jgi:hypothetical protein
MVSTGGQRCSLGTYTVLGLVTNGLLGLSPDGGAENWSLILPGNPKIVPPDCPFDAFSASSSGSARRLLIVAGLTGCVVNAELPCALDRKAITPAIRISVLLIGFPLRNDRIVHVGVVSVIPLAAKR